MTIKSAVTSEGMPVKIKPFSVETLASECKKDAFQDILCIRIQSYYESHEYMKKQEEFDAIYDEVEGKAPGLKALFRLHDLVTEKEVECFDAGYKAGMNDLMTALTLNNLQIINTEIVDMKAVDARRREANADNNSKQL